MARHQQSFFFTGAVCALVMAATTSLNAATIIKLSLNGSGPDVEYSGGVLSTFDDGHPTIGDQNTSIEFLDFLDAVEPDVLTSTASFSLDGLVANGQATVFNGALVLQNFAGGTMSLWDPMDNLLLSGTLAASALTGPLGLPATGGLFTTSFASVTGGSLQAHIDPSSLTISMSLADINGGSGFSVTPAPPGPLPAVFATTLDPFTADATANIAGEVIPEPGSLCLLLLGGVLATAAARRRYL